MHSSSTFLLDHRAILVTSGVRYFIRQFEYVCMSFISALKLNKNVLYSKVMFWVSTPQE